MNGQMEPRSTQEDPNNLQQDATELVAEIMSADPDIISVALEAAITVHEHGEARVVAYSDVIEEILDVAADILVLIEMSPLKVELIINMLNGDDIEENPTIDPNDNNEGDALLNAGDNQITSWPSDQLDDFEATSWPAELDNEPALMN